MYSSRSRYGRGQWYVAVFWLVIGFLLGQISPIKLSLAFKQSSTPPAVQQPAQPTNVNQFTNNQDI